MPPQLIEIGKRRIGDSAPTFVIAEAGVNHNGDVGMALDLVRAAKRAGADCIKFQTFTAERVITPAAPKARYQLRNTSADESQFAMLQALELPTDAYEPLLALCADLDIVFMSTPYSMEDVSFLAALGVDAIKLASIHAAEPAFLAAAARKGRPLILSTGMATMSEVGRAVDAMRGAGLDEFVLLQCTTDYPARLADANLKAMATMRDAFQAMIGYSDHTEGDTAPIAAVALGAQVIEKHFTLDRRLPGPDQSTSLEPDGFARLVSRIRETEVVLGDGLKRPSASEAENSVAMRRSIAAARDLKAGATLTLEDLANLRPASGIPPALIDEVVGRIVMRDIARGALLDWADLGSSDG